MDRELALRGTEELSFELTGRLPSERARSLLPRGLGPSDRGGFTEVGLTVFRMRGLGLRGLKGPGFDYSEALWRLSVVHADRESWYAIACDLDSAWIRTTGRLLIRYPVRAARFNLDREHIEVRSAGGKLGVRVSTAPPDTQAPRPQRPLLVASGGRLWRVPWAEVPAPISCAVEVDVHLDTLGARTLGPIEWAATAERLEGRGHRCGLAQLVV